MMQGMLSLNFFVFIGAKSKAKHRRASIITRSEKGNTKIVNYYTHQSLYILTVFNVSCIVTGLQLYCCGTDLRFLAILRNGMSPLCECVLEAVTKIFLLANETKIL